MAEPRIQYAKTSDGVSIAYWTLGEGRPLVFIPSVPLSHIQVEWAWPLARRAYEVHARRRKLVRYDGRGSGLSSRDVTDFSLDKHLLDLEAVVDRLGSEKIALLGHVDGGAIAIAYAASHPERVTHLIVWAAYARGGFNDEAEVQAMTAMMDRDWRLFTETLAHTFLSWSASEEAAEWAQYWAECTTPEVAKAAWEATFDFDVMDLLPAITARTLVLHPSQVRWASMDQSTLLASEIPDARLAVLEGRSGVDIFDESGAVMGAINEFLAEGEEAEEKVDLPTGMTAILFADIANSTALTERLGDAVFREKARDLDTSLRTSIREHGGMPIEGKLLGDGVLATFSSASQAIEAALRCGAAGEDCGLPLHLGIHAGDVIREDNNVYGGAVNIAARIASASAPGEVLVSQTVRDLARTSADVSFEDRGRKTLKGVEGRQRLFEARWEPGPAGGEP
jgi:class 3 adenylate cyclase/pimeloyl-ACP methyl ester carboxylesterase